MTHVIVILLLCLFSVPSSAQVINKNESASRLDAYFKSETKKVSDNCLTDIDSLEAWNQRRPERIRQLRDMLGLDPLPQKTDLKPQITGRTETDAFIVENLHFQSRPGLYVTANLYLPKTIEKPLPTILYVCGHGGVKHDGVSYGNKVHYHHHGSWFARNGYACLTIDSLQLGEIEGIHHGTYRYNKWWWLNRGYTPAGVEAWNCIRALDYLETRQEVDANRFGVTGRSGGGIYSWWVAALDDRIKAAVPVAGITDLENHVVDGCVEGHCDCMYFVNTYRWDYPMLAAMVAPRPLLISNTDRDSIFPLDGVVRTHAKVKSIYSLYNADDKLALHVTQGPHKDTQELRIHAFRWFNKHLKNDDSLIDKTAVSYFEPAQLQVFKQGLPTDQINTKISDSFVPQRQVSNLKDLMTVLREKVFRGWPTPEPFDIVKLDRVHHDKITITKIEFSSQQHVRLPMILISNPPVDNQNDVRLCVATDDEWEQVSKLLNNPDATQLDGINANGPAVTIYFAPRGMGDDQWQLDPKKHVQIRRRFYLLGQTLDGMRVWDIVRAIQVVKGLDICRHKSIHLVAKGKQAVRARLAALFSPVNKFDNAQLSDFRDGPFLLNISKFASHDQINAILDQGPKVHANPARRTENVLLVTVDGLRWQEVFGGSDSRLINKEFGDVRNTDAVKQRFWHDDIEKRRRLLLPFLWQSIAKQGQVFGNPEKKAIVTCTNNRLFSYPGYNELLCGFADPTIDSNAKKYNKNVSVLEWIQNKPAFQGKVRAFCSWDVFPFILNEKRSGIPINAGWPQEASSALDLETELPKVWDSVRYDGFTIQKAMESLRRDKPRVLYVALGETDDWAHEGRYDLYLDAARRNDKYVQLLWQQAQNLPQYRGKTTMILTTDHGRGDGRESWKSHGADISGSDKMWIAAIGPDTLPRGEIADSNTTQSQVAATVADVLGLDFTQNDSRIAKPLRGIRRVSR